MHKFILSFGAVVIASVCAAAIGHAYCPAFCIATKPVTWPLLFLAGYGFKRYYNQHKKERK